MQAVKTSCCRALALSIVLVSSHASASGNDETESLIAEGLSLRKAGKDDEALKRFQRAYATSPSPRARAQIALAEQALGQWIRAELDLESALASEADPWIVKNRTALDSALAIVRRHVGRLEVRSEPDAEVFVDGAKRDLLPGETNFRLEAGPHVLEVRAAGFVAVTRTIEVLPGALTRETVSLVRRLVESEPPPPAVGTPSSSLTRGPVALPVEPVERGPNVLAWAITLAGGALIGTGAVSRWQRERNVNAYNEDPKCGGIGSSAQSAECASRIDAEQSWSTISVVSFVAGGILTVGGVALLLSSPRGSSRQNVSAACSPGFAALSCSGTF
jgi:hypothetical protein